jgi:hypothetical protein
MSGLSYEFILLHDNREPSCSEYPSLTRIDEVCLYPGYAEPGYTDPKAGILVGKWNEFSNDAAELLRRAGYELEWSDEWVGCSECGLALRTVADSYLWQPSYIIVQGELFCKDCMAEYIPEYLAALEDNYKMAVHNVIDPAEYGYKLLHEGYENGWHGTKDDPKDILRTLQQRGVSHVLFQITQVRQGSLQFAVWKKEELTEASDGELTEYFCADCCDTFETRTKLIDCPRCGGRVQYW